MRNINLLPRKTLFDQLFPTLLVTVITLYICIALFLTLLSLDKNSTKHANENRINELKSQIQQLTNQRHDDMVTEEYNKFNEEISRLKSSRINWIPIFKLVTLNLSQPSRIVQMGVGEEGVLTLDLEIKSLTQIADYIVLLQNSPLQQKVSINKITRVQLEQAVETTSQDKQEFPAPPEEIPALPLTNNDSDALLNQLQRLVKQKFAEKQLNADPSDGSTDQTSTAPNASLPDDKDGVFSTEEIAKAKENLQRLKLNPITPDQIALNSLNKFYTYYQVNLALTIKTPVPEK